ELSGVGQGGRRFRPDRHRRGLTQVASPHPGALPEGEGVHARVSIGGNPVSHPLFDKHRAMLERALTAIAERSYWSAFPESASPKVYGEGAAEAGKAAFDALRGRPFALDADAPGGGRRAGRERSPFGFDLGITYAAHDVDALFAAVGKA